MEAMSEGERFQQGNIPHDRPDPMRKEVFEFFMEIEDDKQMTRAEAIHGIKAVLGIIAVDEELGQGTLFEPPKPPERPNSGIVDH